MLKFLRLCVIGAFVFLFGGETLRAQVSVSQRIDDLRLGTSVRLALLENGETRALDVRVQAADEIIVLSGLVPTLGDRSLVENAVSGLRNVRSVRNDLRLEGQPDTLIVDPVEPDNVEVEESPNTPLEVIDEVPHPEESSEPVYHRVVRGDTLYGIARQYDTSLATIQGLNNMTSTTIRIGQRIRVR